ncbi:MAG: molybdenum cofactor guanylyltransferase [Longimicrobiales bacterium]
MNARVCGAAIAGGRSTRYGSPKSFATVGERMLIERVLDALRAVSDEQIIIANDPAAYERFGLPVRADVLAGAGAIAGIHAALLYAAEHGCSGVLAVACDMPFPSADLLRALRDHAVRQGADVVVPASDGPRGMEPLFAYYAIACIAPIERAVARDDRRVIGFHDDVHVALLPAEDVRRFGDPARMFMNVNTPAERARAEALAALDA